MVAITVGGALTIGWLLLAGPALPAPGFVPLLLVAFITAGEALPITLVRAGRTAELTLSTMFAFAALLVYDATFAALTLAGAALAVDLLRRRALLGVLFNAAQLGLAVAAAGVVLTVSPDPQPPLASAADVVADLPFIAGAGAAFFAVNYGLTVPVLLLGGAAPRPLLTSDLLRQVGWAVVLLSPAPLVVAIAVTYPALLPLLVAPMAALYRSATVLMERDRRALHDTLTGLPNRDLFTDRAHQAVAAAQRRGETCALVVVDLDHFKEVNDTLGHPVGDRLLAAIAKRLAAQARDADTVARLGGDEFGVVLVPPISAVDAERVAARIGETIAAPVNLEGLPIRVEASVGIALHPAHGDDAATLFARADAAMFRAKRSRVGSALYAPTDATDDDRLWLLARLRAAVDQGALEVWYQPQHAVASGEIVGVEALLRWPSAGTWTPPSQFVPVAEQSGLMRALTAFVLDHALARQQRWREAGWQGRVGVNISLRDLEDPAFPDEVTVALDRHGLPAAALELEISQRSIATAPTRVAAALEALHAMGTGLAIDDFGTGSTSLWHLRALPVDTLKIDQTFFTDPASAADLAIVASTVALGQMLELRVVGKGIEHEMSLERLRDLGCNGAQGYYLSRPMPADEVGALLESNDGASPEVPRC